MKCDFCNNRADYKTGDGSIHWCEDCYISMADEYEAYYEDDYGMPFDEYYDTYRIYHEYDYDYDDYDYDDYDYDEFEDEDY